jgi:hypothetical protein
LHSLLFSKTKQKQKQNKNKNKKRSHHTHMPVHHTKQGRHVKLKLLKVKRKAQNVLLTLRYSIHSTHSTPMLMKGMFKKRRLTQSIKMASDHIIHFFQAAPQQEASQTKPPCLYV